MLTNHTYKNFKLKSYIKIQISNNNQSCKNQRLMTTEYGTEKYGKCGNM